MSAPDENPYTLITDAAAVAATLADLRDQSEPVLLRGIADGRSHHVVLTETGGDPPRLVWQRADASPAMPVSAGDMLQLEARRRAGHLVSSAMRCDLVLQDSEAGRPTLRTRLPLRLTLRHARQDWRARLIPGEMVVRAKLARPGAPAVQGLLVDLSVGGCRLALNANSTPLELEEPINLRLTFPNGDEWLFGGRIRDIAAHAGAATQAGLVFAGLTDEQARQLWYLTCEIDREAERRQRVRGELRRLAPSPLFDRVHA
ncbi:PilZ domain-containing protein [Salinisphaera sp. SPP-AMP-43]|uniref:PilZ domain-containing protein n=1 Tax=Salinisphaera sp. SPP-AMP-43 TaxID=3121288 RepID=UPI003C6E96AE